MELKQNLQTYLGVNDDAFNQTRMELKHVFTWNTTGGADSFNQTRMELKRFTLSISLSNLRNLLIRPEWN